MIPILHKIDQANANLFFLRSYYKWLGVSWVILSLFCFVLSERLVFAKDTIPTLSNRSIAQIVDQFINLHYAKLPLDDAIGIKTLRLYINTLDPGHYYFLAADVEEFKKSEQRIDDMLKRGDVDLAFHIFTRFKTRLEERLKMIEQFQKDNFDFSAEDTMIIDRKDVQFPLDQMDALESWRVKVKFDLLTLTLAGSTLAEAKERLLTRSRSLFKDYSQYSENDVIALYIGALTRAYDPHSAYLAPQELNNFDIQIKLSLEGIGAVLRWEDGYTVVNSVVIGGAAARDGRLKVEDRIIGVGQEDKPIENVIDMRLNDVVELIRGPQGSRVKLQVLRKSKSGYDPMMMELVRDKIVLKDQEAKSFVLKPGAAKPVETSGYPFQGPKEFKVGVIRLPSFYVDFGERRNNPENFKSASRDVAKLLEQFNQEKVDGVVLDVRFNGGGGLDEAINMAGLFIGRKPVVVVRESFGTEKTHVSAQAKLYDGPLVIMTNRYSASASEILAGALQDYQRAILVGDVSTFGKGSVQNIHQISQQAGALKVTIAQFYRVAGGSTQNKGVESDIVLTDLNNVLEVGESVLENALPWKQIKSLSYTPQKGYYGDLSLYTNLSKERTKKSDFFQKVDKDIQEYLTNVKPRKLISISKLKEEFQKRDASKKEDLAALKKEAKSATALNGNKELNNKDKNGKELVNNTPATESTAKDPAKETTNESLKEGKDAAKEGKATPKNEDTLNDEDGELAHGGRDAYLEESVYILEDMIRNSRKEKKKEDKENLTETRN